jgi:phosphate butyryltransferase
MRVMTEPIVSSDMIIEAARELARTGRKKRVAVAAAQDADVLGAIASAHAEGILDATLFGDREEITRLAGKNEIDISGLDVVHDDSPDAAAYEAVKLAAEGGADVIMKGFVSTSGLLKKVLSSEFDLRTESTVSHAAVLDIPGYHKLLIMTDGGMVVAPNPGQKKQIMINAVAVSRALGISPVRIAVSSGVDAAYESVPQSQAADHFVREMRGLKLDNVEIDGPLSFDAALSVDIARRRGLTGSVIGEADIYLVDTIEECNIIAKALINYADAVFAGVIVGARVPVSLVSRTDTMKNKKASVSIACLVAEYFSTPDSGGER